MRLQSYLLVSVILGPLTGMPIWSQVENGIGAAADTGDDSQMQIPPPASVWAYPALPGDEERSNYLRMGLRLSGGYIDNLYAGGSGSPVSDTTWSIEPSISLDKTTSRQHLAFTYGPGFMFYQPTSVLNQPTHSLSGEYRLRLTPHTAITATDGFWDGLTLTGLTYSGVGGTVPGSSQSAVPGVVPPFAEMISNIANGEFTAQTGRRTMIGITGMATILQYPNQREATGLYNSSSRGASAFYNYSISGSQYVGATYQYTQFLTFPVGATSETQTHTLTFFYTIYPIKKLSLSLSAGPQHYQATQAPLPSFAGWEPSVTASAGWQARHTTFAASYSHQVTGGGGLLGAFTSSTAVISVRRRQSRLWMVGADLNYWLEKTVTPALSVEFVTPALSVEFPGGHTVSGSANLKHWFSPQLSMTVEYDQIHEAFAGVTSIVSNPGSSRETLSLAWQFSRPLGR